MIRPEKICKNPECKEKFSDYVSAKKEYCCTKCTQRGGYLRRLEENKEEVSLKKERKSQYELIELLWKYAKKPISVNLLDHFKIDYNLLTKGIDEHGHPYYSIKNKGIYRNPSNPKEILIKLIVKRKK